MKLKLTEPPCVEYPYPSLTLLGFWLLILLEVLIGIAIIAWADYVPTNPPSVPF